MNRFAAVRPVSQVMLQLRRDKPDPFNVVRDEVLDWVRWKAGKTLPKQAWEGQSFELDDVGAQRVAAARLDKPPYWAARVDDACKEVAQRTWITEIGLAAAPNGGIAFGCRLIVAARGENPRFQPSVPAFVRKVVSSGPAFLEGRRISATDPWIVDSEHDVGELHALMLSKQRRSDICVFSLAENDTDPASAAASPAAVHRQTLGAAHVVVLTGPAAFALTDRVGKEFSVFNRAVRTYRPGFDTETDDPYRHPIAMAHRIAGWQENGVEGPEAFESFLVRTAIIQTVSASDLEAKLPPFSEVRRAAAASNLEKAREDGASREEMLRLFEDDNVKLRTALDEEKAIHAGLLADAERERDEAQRRVEESKGELYRLRHRLRALEQQSKNRRDHAEPPIPATLTEIKDWADTHLSGSVVLHGRALRGAKESDYESPQLVYQALLVLRDFYVPMRRGEGDVSKDDYSAALRNLGLEDSPSISPTRVGEQGDEYFVQHHGQKRLLERHLKKGTSKETRLSFRFYFFWDDEEEQVVVGWLTSHLDTRQS